MGRVVEDIYLDSGVMAQAFPAKGVVPGQVVEGQALQPLPHVQLQQVTWAPGLMFTDRGGGRPTQTVTWEGDSPGQGTEYRWRALVTENGDWVLIVQVLGPLQDGRRELLPEMKMRGSPVPGGLLGAHANLCAAMGFVLPGSPCPPARWGTLEEALGLG